MPSTEHHLQEAISHLQAAQTDETGLGTALMIQSLEQEAIDLLERVENIDARSS